jgi:probable rRNA maturation factor
MRIAADVRLCDAPRMTDPHPSDDVLPLVDVIIEDDRWADFGLNSIADTAARATLGAVGLPAEGFTICLMGCDDARIAVLNESFRGKGQPTNVLSWPSEERGAATGVAPDLPDAGPRDDPTELGDIALAFDICMAEAAAQGKSEVDHVTHLIVHGLLHLLGYDHIEAPDAALMEAIEVRVLAPLGVSDPY